MLMRAKEHWHCVNPACGCQVVVEVSGGIHGQNPRCACGDIMKKKYAARSYSYLEFLRIDEPPAAEPSPKDEEPCLSPS